LLRAGLGKRGVVECVEAAFEQIAGCGGGRARCLVPFSARSSIAVVRIVRRARIVDASAASWC
jgi:hypothetical protein